MTEILTFEKYAELHGKSKAKMLELQCCLSDVAIVEELKQYEHDFYYTAFILQQPIDKLYSYPIFKKRFAAEFQVKYRRQLIEAGRPDPVKLMNIPPEFQTLHFDNLVDFPEHYKEEYLPKDRRQDDHRRTIPGQKNLIDKAKHFCSKQLLSMLITGSFHGQGKSLVCSCILKQKFIELGLSSIDQFDDSYELFNSSILFINEWQLISLLDLLPEQKYLRYSLQMIIRRLSDVDVLVIDDMFRSNDPATRLRLLDIYEPITYNRIEIRKKDLIINSNYTPFEFAKISGYIYSRLKPGIIHNCEYKKDYRGILKANQ